VNVHAAMKMKEIESILIRVSQKATRILQLGEYLNSLAHMNTKLCIFFDEFNTSSHMGVLKEVITNHTINGVDIASNVVIVAACNPARAKLNFFSDRKQEYGIEFVSGHYQTQPLPPLLR
jgi:ABC-type histidine transport system ATPase subunit